MTPKIVDKDRKAREIAAAALRVFGERGFHATRMADIAAAAGVGKGTLYEYFADKMEILAAELDRYFQDFEAGAMAAVGSAMGSESRLAALVGFALAHVEGWADHCAAFFDAVGSARAGGLGAEWFADVFDRSRALVGGILEEGRLSGEIRAEVDVEATAESIVSLYEGYVLLTVLGVRSSSPERVRDAMVSLLRRGLAAGSPPAPTRGGRQGEGTEKEDR
jgi:AcrR family transcriptional regulator